MATRKRTHSAAHRKAISDGLKRYHAGKGKKSAKKKYGKYYSRKVAAGKKARSKKVIRPRDPGNHHGTSVKMKDRIHDVFRKASITDTKSKIAKKLRKLGLSKSKAKRKVEKYSNTF